MFISSLQNQKDFLLSWEATIICWTDQLIRLTSLNDQLKPLVTSRYILATYMKVLASYSGEDGIITSILIWFKLVLTVF